MTHLFNDIAISTHHVCMIVDGSLGKLTMILYKWSEDWIVIRLNVSDRSYITMTGYDVTHYDRDQIFTQNYKKIMFEYCDLFIKQMYDRIFIVDDLLLFQIEHPLPSPKYSLLFNLKRFIRNFLSCNSYVDLLD